MKIKELIKNLREVEELNPNGNVYIDGEESSINFSGFSCDDNNEVLLYITEGDEKA